MPTEPELAIALEIRIMLDESRIGREKGRGDETLFVLRRCVFQIEQWSFFKVEKWRMTDSEVTDMGCMAEHRNAFRVAQPVVRRPIR